MKLLDLDKLVPENKEVVLGGKMYVLPGALPVGWMLRLMAAGSKLSEEINTVDAMREALDVLAGVLSLSGVKVDVDELAGEITQEQFGALVKFLYETGAEGTTNPT